MNIAQKRKELAKKQPTTLYQKAAQKFECTYKYVTQIAVGTRMPTKGKGKLIKAWLIEQLEAKNL